MHKRRQSRLWFFDGAGRGQDVMYHVACFCDEQMRDFFKANIINNGTHRGRAVKAID